MNKRTGILILVVIHLVGVCAMYTPYQSFFVTLSPYNLLLTAFVLFYKRLKTHDLIPLGIVFVSGLGVEMLGVNTGFPFGEYVYSKIFGPQIFNTPLLIGLLWTILMYSFDRVLRHRISKPWVLALSVGMGMTLLDFFIEPVAISLNFWSWEKGFPPTENYLSWFIVSVLLSFVLTAFRAKSSEVDSLPNPLAIWVLWMQFGFFIALQGL